MRDSDPRAVLTGTVTEVQQKYFVIGHGGARIYFKPGDATPRPKVGDNVTVVTSRLGGRNVAERITPS